MIRSCGCFDIKSLGFVEKTISLQGIIKGVEETPYEGGIFELDIKIGESYPFKAPTVTVNLCGIM